MNQQYFLRWNNHQPNFISVFSNLLTNESLVDVTLAAEGKHIQAHKVVLSACSNYFQTLFSVNPCRHPIVILKDISYNDLKYIVEFIYYGEVSVTEEQLSTVIKAAESLQIKGLANIQELNSSNTVNTNYRRKRVRKSSTGSGCTVTTDSFEEVEVVVPTNISSGNSSLGTASATTVIASSSATYSPGTIPSIKSSSEEIENGAATCKREQGTSGIQQTDNNDMIDISVKQKRPRILIRQPRVRKDFDGNGSDSDEFGVKHTITRQYSDPTPQNSSTKYTTSNRKQSKQNLLTISPPLHLIKQHSDSDIINQQQSDDASARSDEFRHSASQTLSLPLKTTEARSNHCPALRAGPALGCNHCWNTIDTRGRILRRKTKYHCPECRTNLCIVPCFQDFHDKSKTVADDNHQENDRQGEYHELYQQTCATPTNKNTSSV